MIKDFIYVNSPFEAKYSGPLSCRWLSMKAALNLAANGLHGAPISILETGCQRMIDDWGGGCSTLLFADFLENYAPEGSQFLSIDLSRINLNLAQSVIGPTTRFNMKFIESDSISALTSLLHLPAAIDTRFDFIYLDSMDCDPREPEGELQTKESQKHQLLEANVAVQLFGDRNPFKILMLDDNNLPWGGKCTLTKKWLEEELWACVFDSQQSLWIQKNEKFQVW